jgi:pyrroloquinoline quinone biosynthesis protein D
VTPLDPASRPRLARGVRTRLDRLTGKHLLLRPEQGFELQGSALEVVALCTGELSIAVIVERLTAAHPEVPHEQLAGDIHRLLGDLGRRGVIEMVPP